MYSNIQHTGEHNTTWLGSKGVRAEIFVMRSFLSEIFVMFSTTKAAHIRMPCQDLWVQEKWGKKKTSYHCFLFFCLFVCFLAQRKAA
jgi:hypothetical protein